MRFFHCVAVPWLSSLVFWSLAIACVDAPLSASDIVPFARVIITWDPAACTEPHRVVIELEDDAGAPLSSSAPCAIGGLAFDAPHFGIYRGRIYAWQAGEPIRSQMPVRLVVDEPIVRWIVSTP
jgi:hypothetical protein